MVSLSFYILTLAIELILTCLQVDFQEYLAILGRSGSDGQNFCCTRIACPVGSKHLFASGVVSLSFFLLTCEIEFILNPWQD